jgi:hypothetical protein
VGQQPQVAQLERRVERVLLHLQGGGR